MDGVCVENRLALITGFFGSLVAYMFDLVGVAVTILIFFMTLDYITGLIAAAVQRQLNSRIGLEGFARKLYILILISAVYALEFMGSHYADFEIMGGHIGDGVAFAYVAIEFISITENGVKMNAPIPGILKQLLKIVKEKTGIEDEK